MQTQQVNASFTLSQLANQQAASKTKQNEKSGDSFMKSYENAKTEKMDKSMPRADKPATQGEKNTKELMDDPATLAVMASATQQATQEETPVEQEEATLSVGILEGLGLSTIQDIVSAPVSTSQGVMEPPVEAIQEMAQDAPLAHEDVMARMPQTAPATMQAALQDAVKSTQEALPYPLENASRQQPVQTLNNQSQEDSPLSLMQGVATSAQTMAHQDQMTSANQNQEKQGAQELLMPETTTPAITPGQLAAQPRMFSLTQQPTQGANEIAQTVHNQMVEQMTTQMQSGVREMQIALKPDALGRMTIQLTMGETGLTAKILTNNQEVRAAVSGQIAMLSESLREKGITVVEMDVVYDQMSSPNEFGSHQRQSSQYQPEHHSNRSLFELAEPNMPITGASYDESTLLGEHSSIEFSA